MPRPGVSRRSPTVRHLREGLVLVETRMEGFDVRSAVIVGSRGVVVFDTLAHPDDMAPVRGLVEGRPVTVVYSHADWDHAWGTCGLEAPEEVVAHAAALERFRSDVPQELAARRAVAPTEWGDVELVPPDRVLDGPLDLDLGDVNLTLVPLPGHTEDSLVGLIRPWGMLLAGDAVETPLPVVNDGAAVPGWILELERWADDPDVEMVVPSHGDVGGPELLVRTADYLRDILGGADRGATIEPREPFYRDAHRRNLELARLAGAVAPPSRP